MRDQSQRFKSQIVAAVCARFVLNSARRFAYPFAPTLSRELGVPITAITTLIAANQFTSLIGVFLGPLTDRLGYRRMMVAAMLVMVLGMCIGGYFATYLFVLLATLMAGIGKSVFDPAIQAHLGKQVPFRHRARAVGLIEISWALSSLIGIPIIGFVMHWAGWQSAFWFLAAMGLLCLIGIVRIIPPDTHQTTSQMSFLTWYQSWKALVRNRSALGATGFSFCLNASNDALFVVFGAWMEASFGLGLVSIGIATSVIGAAELLGEGTTALLSDRIGLKRAVVIGAALTSAGYLLLTTTGQNLTMALAALFILFWVFEFTIVTNLSLCTELHPSARATMMSGLYAVAALGRVAGAFTGGMVWALSGWTMVCVFAATVNALGVLFLLWGLHGKKL